MATNQVYTENFADLANWTNNFAAGTGASRFGGLATSAGAVPTATAITHATTTFVSGTSGGVQRGTQALQLLATGTTDNTNAAAVDFYMDFTGVYPGSLSFDWAEVNNSTGDRKGSLKVYWTTDGTTWTELSGAAVANITNNVASSGTVFTALPSNFGGAAGARLRFYYHNGTGGSSGNRPKISIDNLTVTAFKQNVNGTISAAEYGTHSNGENQQGSATGTWYMSWDSSFLYVGLSSPNTAEGAVLYLDKSPTTPINGGTNSDGTLVGYNNYDGTSFAALPFRADLAVYFKDGYREYRTANGANGWGTAVTSFGGYASTGGTVREIAIPWSAIGGMPGAFAWTGYVAYTGGGAYASVPTENPGSGAGTIIGSSARWERYYTVSSTTIGSETKPFSRNSFVFNNASDESGVGAISAYDFTMNSSGRTLTRGSGAWSIAGNMRVDAGTVSFGSTTDAANVSGGITIGSGGTLTLSSAIGGDLGLNGNWSNAGTFNCTNRAVAFSGASAQTLTGATTYDYLTLSNSAGLTLSSNVTVNQLLTLTNGKLTTGANTLTLGTSATVSGAGAGKYVLGNLARTVGTGSSTPTFDIGDATNYTPVQLAFSAVGTGGTLTASTTATAHPVSNALSATKRVNRYWTLTNSGIAGATYDATFNFVAGDVGGGASTSALNVGKYDGSSWSYPTVGTRTSTSTQATGLTSFSDFALAESGNWTITATSGSNGTVTPAGATSVANAGSQTYTITPDAHYHVVDVLVDNITFLGPVTSYTFTNVTADHQISATFAIDTYTITASADANGSIAPSGVTTVNYGGSQSYTITPNSGYHVADVLVNAASVGAVTSYSFTGVAANHTIAASFAANPAVISANSPSGTLSSVTTTLNVPVTISRVDATANRLFHVKFQLGGGLSLAGDTSSVVEGDYLTSGGGGVTTFFHVTDNGGGLYTADGTILGAPCNNVATTGTLFTIPVTSTTGSGTGTVTLTETTLRDCDNATLASSIGTAASVPYDVTLPTVSVTAPNGGEFWAVGSSHNITWTASDDIAVTSVDIAYSTDGGATYPNSIATGVANSGTYAWTIPSNVSAMARVRVSAHDAAGNTGSDASDADFTIGQWTITASAGANGSIAPVGVTSLNDGGSQSYTITPNAHFHIADVLVDGVSVGAVGSYDFTGVTANHTIAASFAIDTYTITASAGLNGSIAPTGVTTLDYGTDQTYTITPAANYHVASLVVDGEAVTPATSYTFTSVSQNHTIAVTFAIDTYTITASAGSNGSIAPSGAVSVNHGADQTFTITPAANYHVATLLVDGDAVTPASSYTFSNVTAAHTIAVTFAIDTHTITASAGANGSITPSGAVSVDHGSDQAFTITPATNYHVANLVIDGTPAGAATSYTFTNVTEDHSIVANFAIDAYTITASAGANGSITPSGAVSVDHGSDQSFTITPATNYHVANLVIDGTPAGAATSYTFTNVTENHSIVANFAIDTYTITASAGANGSITPSGSVTVNHGDDQTFTITPAANYHVATLLVDGDAVTPANSYTFTNVTTAHTIAVTFAIDQNIITASAGANGSITPSGAVAVDYGSDQTFTITPATNYHVATLLVDGDAVTPASSYTFTNVTTAHTIAVTFAIDQNIITASAGANGSITPSGAVAVDYGSDQTFTITPAANYHVATLLVDGDAVTPANSYTFTNVTTAHTIAATFAIDQNIITASAGANGSITPSGAVAVDYGSDQTFTITPAANFHVATLLVDGDAVTPASSYTFTNVTTAHTIAVTFAIDTYTITASAGANGSITPSGSVTVNHGDDQAFTIMPATNHHVANLVIDGTTVGAATSYTFTNVTENHSIVANFAIDTYTITASAGANGSITPSGSVSVDHGADQAFTITPATNYHVANLVIDGTTVGAATSYTFTNVTENHSIVANFAIDTYTITASAGANGSITPSGVTTLDYGTDQTYTITPAANYHVASVLVDGGSVGPVTSYTFTAVSANHTIAASFAIDQNIITASAGANGSITPSGAVAVDYGANQSFTITPAAHYHVAGVLVDGGPVGAVTSYTFTNVTTSHTIAASFAIDTYTITASAGSNGAIAPNGVTTVNYGASQSYTITPDPTYHVADVLVDDVSVGPVTTYSFTAVEANHTIAATFGIDQYTITASAGAHGSIVPNGTIGVSHGDSRTFTITPDEHYHVADVLVDDVSVGPVTTYTFTNVTASHSISASFAIDTFTITASAGPNGSIAPAGVTTLDYGTNQAYTITPAANYHVASVLVDGGSVGPVTSYTFTAVSANHTIAASFAIDQNIITASAGANGSITPSGAVAVDFGANQSFTITPAVNYHVANLVIDGTTIGAATSYTFTNVTETHTIVANFAIDTHTITASAGANGSITPSGAVSVNHGDDQAFTITPAANYHVASLVIDGTPAGAATSYTFTNVTEDHSIVASFAIDTHTITASAGANGSITPSGAVSVDHGADQSFTITPAANYHVASLVIDGTPAGAATSYTFTNVTEDHSIVASFAIDTHTITASAGANGSITPSGAVSVNHGDDQSFTITPAVNYHVASLVIDGTPAGAATSYTFTNVTEDHSIVASFAIDTHTITASAGSNGSITPSGAVSVNHGDDQSFTITPAANYHVASLVIDGTPAGAATSYTFTDVTEDHSIVASFAIDTHTITASAGANGSITPSGAVSVDHGADQSFTITPAANYHVASLVIDGTPAGAATSYTFTNVTEDHSIVASFAIDTHTITASAGANGSITPSGAVSVNHGDDQTFTITPAVNYHVANLVIDGTPAGAATSYTFTNVTEDHSIVANFAIDTHTITASAGANGSITPSGSVTVNHGDDQSFTITPAVNYHVASLVIDGTPAGAATSYTFTNVTEDHSIVASFSIDTHTITASAGSNGSITPSGAVSVNHGDDQSFTITPAVNYHVANLVIDGTPAGAATSYTFTNVTEDHSIVASFAIDTHTITASAGANGSITPSGAVSVNHGDDQSFTITPAVNYHVASLVIDGTPAGAATSYTFTNVTEDHSIVASFAIDTHTITASAGSNGSITPSGAVSVNHGDDQSFTITPAANYHVASLVIDGTPAGAATSYTFTNVTEDHSIVANFAIDTHTITASAGANGSITPSGAVSVNHGDDQSFTITPAANYHVASLVIDGTPAGAATSYTFTNVTEDHSIVANFAIDAHTITASAGANGSITPSGAVSVSHGDSQAFTIAANAGHHILDVLVDAASVGAVSSYTFTDVTADHTIAASFEANPAVPALALSASQVKTGNDTDGTTKILLNWAALPASSSVAVYRAPYGSYPEFDDASGTAPSAPSFPPSAPWSLTSVTAPNTTDEVVDRDFYYYVAFVTDTFGTVSPVSNVAGGVLNYHLGDVTDGVTPGQGNNAVDIADVSLLGSHYGLTGTAVAAFNWLDVGPTTNASVNARPTTDNRIDFEDLILFAINYQLVSAPQMAARPMLEAASSDELSLDRPATFGADGRMTVHMNFRGTGMVQGMSMKLSWDPAVVTLENTVGGQMADDLGAMVLSGTPGVIDVAMMGVSSGLQGEGTIASATFRRIGPGEARIELVNADGRDAGNGHVAISVKAAGIPAAPLVTSFSRISPNPFRANANMNFALSKGGAVELALYSVDGRLVRRLVHGTREAGQYQIGWDGRDEAGSLVPAGVYYARLVTQQGTFNRSLVYLK